MPGPHPQVGGCLLSSRHGGQLAGPRALGLCQGSLQGSPWPGTLGVGWRWGCAGSVGSPLPVSAANHSLGCSEASFRVRLLTPSHREKLRLGQAAQLGRAQDARLGGHTPAPAPWLLYSTVLQPKAAPDVDCLRLIHSLHPAFVCF